jgi:hypothetical protein
MTERSARARQWQADSVSAKRCVATVPLEWQWARPLRRIFG